MKRVVLVLLVEFGAALVLSGGGAVGLRGRRLLGGAGRFQVGLAVQAAAAQPVPLPEPRPIIKPVSAKPHQRPLRRHLYIR